jgi:uncharacterized protein
VSARIGRLVWCLLVMVMVLVLVQTRARAQDVPELTSPVNDFAGVIDPGSEAQLEMLIRALQQASGDVVVVATVPSVQSYGDIRQYAVEMFENHGRGIGQKGVDNGLLVLLAVEDREVWVETGYDLEQFITDGFAGETSRQVMIPEFRQGGYGPGLVAGVSRLVGRIAEGRNVTLEGVAPPPRPRRRTGRSGGGSALTGLFILFILLNLVSGRLRGNRHRRRGWFSGVGPFGGGFGGLGGGFRGGGFRGGGFGGGGFGGGGFGGGFGGFGGGRSGGGGGGGSW